MTTKEFSLPDSFYQKQKNVILGDNLNDHFNNLNLNQNCSFSLDTFCSKSIATNESYKQSNYAFNGINNSKANSISWNKLEKNLNSISLNQENNNKKELNVKSSTLSLHISTYENESESLNQNLKLSNLIQKCSKIKSQQSFIISTLIIQNPYEFPRQQEEAEKIKEPEVAEFKSTQKLLNPNESVKTHINNYSPGYLSDEGRYNSLSPRKSLSPRNFRSNDREDSRDRSDSRGPPSLDRNTSIRDGRASNSDGREVENKRMIFISGLPQSVNETFINDVFGGQGQIDLYDSGKAMIKIYSDRGISKGECTITFRTEDSASAAIQNFNGQNFPGTQNIMDISYAKFPSSSSRSGGDRGGRGGGGGFGGGDRRGSGGGSGGFGGGRGGGFGDRGGDRDRSGYDDRRSGGRGGYGDRCGYDDRRSGFGGGRGGGFGGDRERRGGGLGGDREGRDGGFDRRSGGRGGGFGGDFCGRGGGFGGDRRDNGGGFDRRGGGRGGGYGGDRGGRNNGFGGERRDSGGFGGDRFGRSGGFGGDRRDRGGFGSSRDGGRGGGFGGRDGGGRDGGRGGGFGGRDGGGRGGGRDGGGRGGFGGRGGCHGGEGRQGDWTCPCGNTNFAFRQQCNSCQAPRADGGGAPHSGGGAMRGPPRNGGDRGGGDRHRPY